MQSAVLRDKNAEVGVCNVKLHNRKEPELAALVGLVVGVEYAKVMPTGRMVRQGVGDSGDAGVGMEAQITRLH